MHAQPLVVLALVSLLHGCADTYVSTQPPEAAGPHVRQLSTVLMRLGACADATPELASELQVCLSRSRLNLECSVATSRSGAVSAVSCAQSLASRGCSQPMLGLLHYFVHDNVYLKSRQKCMASGSPGL